MSHLNPSIKDKVSFRPREAKPLEYYVDGITKKRDYYILSEAITLLESERLEHRDLAQKILKACYPIRAQSFRFGITGTPGVGKSTFIDRVVSELIQDGKPAGILTIDPSSVDGRGSILGDKTRMEALSKQHKVFIRPSPSKRFLGGIHQFTFEAIIMCEAAGIESIFVETVGTGQSEVDVSDTTDATIVLILPGSGDSLQGIKKGILEKADLLVIHKADGERKDLADQSVRDLRKGLHFSKGTIETPVVVFSSSTGHNKEKLLESLDTIVGRKLKHLKATRKKQENKWLENRVTQHIQEEARRKLDDSNHLAEQPTNKSESPFHAFESLKKNIDIKIKR